MSRYKAKAPLFDQVVQIGIVVPCVKTAVRRYGELLGLTDWHFNEVDSAAGNGANFSFRNRPFAARALVAWRLLGAVELELIEPRDEGSAYAQFLREKGPGVHHIMFVTPDYESCLDRMQASGVPVLGAGELQQTRFHLFDTQADLGLICEIAEGEPLLPDDRPRFEA
jgi:4-hydroxyphenylpyruvate dioxygenase-like putative hemolysin